jgi:hypothetical protein
MTERAAAAQLDQAFDARLARTNLRGSIHGLSPRSPFAPARPAQHLGADRPRVTGSTRCGD